MSQSMSQSSMSGKPVVALNAIHSITLQGFAQRDDGTPEKLTIMRAAPDSSKKQFYQPLSEHDTLYLPSIPAPPPSTLLPEGNVMLELQIGDLLGQSDRNFVYAVTVTNADTIACYVPPLVIKVGKLCKGRNVSEEAGMYQDLECLQGSVIPRCYGYFFTTIDHARIAVLPWDGHDCKYPRTFDRHNPPHPAAPLGVMLLERLGNPIPTGHRTISETMRQELMDIYDELARLGVDRIDWRLGNFLSAPPSPPGLPSLPSPNHKHPYSIRIFDFEFSKRTNTAVRLLKHDAPKHVENLLQDIAFSRQSGHLPSVQWKEVDFV